LAVQATICLRGRHERCGVRCENNLAQEGRIGKEIKAGDFEDEIPNARNFWPQSRFALWVLI
jgi:hypothetical protein